MSVAVPKRALLWITAAIAIAAYWDEKALRGPFIYDDVASIMNNPVVIDENVPWTDAFVRDFWGSPMHEARSHKSYRPLTSLTFRANWINAKSGSTYYFHLVNILIHGINTGLVAETADIVFGGDDIVAPMVASILFGIHPVHAEAVSNITSRGELLMTFFFLLAFLAYVDGTKSLPNNNMEGLSEKNKAKSGGNVEKATQQEQVGTTSTLRSIIFVYCLPWLMTALSTFSKEQGATTLCTLVAYDFIYNHSSVKDFLSKLKQGDTLAQDFLQRAWILTIQTLLLVSLRIWLNGETSPDFVYEQNPAGFAKERFTRVFSVNWTYCLYLRDMVFPVYLAPDWSGDSIPLIESLSDPRAKWVILLWSVAFVLISSLFLGTSPKASVQRKENRRILLISFFAFLFLPFLLSSNILITIGLAKGDRVVYLPLFGFCLIEALIVKTIWDNTRGDLRKFTMVVVAVQIALYGLKLNERNLAWADEYTLWVRAYEVNPRSRHTLFSAGKMLVKNNEYAKGEEALRAIRSVRVNEDPNTTFLYTVALANLDRCEESFPLIDDAIRYLHEEREAKGKRFDPAMSLHSETSLIVSRAFCTKDVMEKGRLLHQAAQMDPNNGFAQTQFQNYMQTMQRMQAMQQQQMQQQQAQGARQH